MWKEMGAWRGNDLFGKDKPNRSSWELAGKSILELLQPTESRHRVAKGADCFGDKFLLSRAQSTACCSQVVWLGLCLLARVSLWK